MTPLSNSTPFKMLKITSLLACVLLSPSISYAGFVLTPKLLDAQYYSNIRSSSSYTPVVAGDWVPSNLFDQTFPNDYILADPARFESYVEPRVEIATFPYTQYRPDLDFAAAGGTSDDNNNSITDGNENVYVSFSLDAIYALSSFGFSQRIGQGGNIELDKTQSISFWFSDTQSFDPSDPSRNPDFISPQLHTSVGYFKEYNITGNQHGRYVLMKFNPHAQQLGNIGGTEFRISGGVIAVPEPGSALLLGLSSLLAFRRRRCVERRE